MTAIVLYRFDFSLKNASNCLIILLVWINYMRSLTRTLERFLVLKPRFLTRLSVWHRQSTKLGFQKIAAASKIILTLQKNLHSKSVICYGLFNLIARGHSYLAKFGLISFLVCLLANGQVLIKVLSNFLFLPIPLDKKKGRNRYVFGKKTFFKAVFLILLLHNSSENAFLLIPLHPVIV